MGAGTIRIEQQLAVFLDNRPGVLAKMCDELRKLDINILALSILDTMDHAVVRMVVDKPQEAKQAFVRMQTVVQVRDVILMEVPNRVGAMADIAERLAAAGINIEYAYCTCPPSHSDGVIVIRTNDLEGTINALS
jgi:hypothetical protein